jgi:ribosomal protein S5
LYRLEDVFGDMKDVTEMAGVEDMMAEVKGTTGAEKGAEATKNGIRIEG